MTVKSVQFSTTQINISKLVEQTSANTKEFSLCLLLKKKNNHSRIEPMVPSKDISKHWREEASAKQTQPPAIGNEVLYFRNRVFCLFSLQQSHKESYTPQLCIVIWGMCLLKTSVYNRKLLLVRFHVYFPKKLMHIHSFRYQQEIYSQEKRTTSFRSSHRRLITDSTYGVSNGQC